MTTFGERIKYLRIKINISQKQLAEDLGYKTFTTVSKWESDSSLPPGKELIKIATYFNVSTDYLLGLENNVVEYSVDNIQNTTDMIYFKSLSDYEAFKAEVNPDIENIATIAVPNHVLFDCETCFFTTKVRTDSMNRILNNGDYVVAYDMTQANLSEMHTGDILIVKIDNEYKIEILRKTDTKIYLEPSSYLEGFDTLVYTLEEFKEVEVIGKIIYSFRQFSQTVEPVGSY